MKKNYLHESRSAAICYDPHKNPDGFFRWPKNSSPLARRTIQFSRRLSQSIFSHSLALEGCQTHLHYRYPSPPKGVSAAVKNSTKKK